MSVIAVEAVAQAEGASEIEDWFPEPRLSAAWLADHFYYSLGDYDVF